MKLSCRKTKVLVSLWAFLLIVMSGGNLYAQQGQTEQNDYEELDKFLPGDDDAKVLLMIQCTVCHSAKSTRERISQRIGGDITFWTTLARRMNSTWNAKIPEEDIDAIVVYLAKAFGPDSPAAKEKLAAEKKDQNTGNQ